MKATPPDGRTLNGSGVFLVTLGAALVLLALSFLDWYSVDGSGADTSSEVTFRSLRASVHQLGGAGLATAFFDWAALTLLIAVVVAGWLASAPWAGADVMRVTGFAAGFLGAALTYFALRQHMNATGSDRGVLYHSTVGTWAAIGGFAVAGVGALFGPRPVTGTDTDR